MKWAALLEFDVPVDLLEAMRVQKTACETIIGKRRLVAPSKTVTK